MPFVNNGPVRLHWDEKGAGTPLLLMMGHAFPSAMWYPVLDALAAHHRVLWFDNRGTGQSDAPSRATASDMAADARAVLDAAEVSRAHVFGVSMGGGLALQIAHETPDRVRSLVLGCTGLAVQTPPVTWTTGLRYRVPLRLARGAMRRSMYGPACPPAAAEADLDLLCRTKVRPRGLVAQARAIASFDLTAEKVADLETPSLVLHGDVDATVPLWRGEDLAAALPNSRLVVYPGLGHAFPVGAPVQVAQDVLEFLSAVDSAIRA